MICSGMKITGSHYAMRVMRRNTERIGGEDERRRSCEK
jgi:hypothetical protein